MNSQNLNGWEKLICPFFGPVCRSSLGAYLVENGFMEKGKNEIGGFVYTRFGVFLEISYELEVVPQALSMVLGIGDNKYDESGHPCCVPYWYLLPRDRKEHCGKGLNFSTAAELERLLVQFKDGFLEPYAKPLWLSPDSLDVVIRNFRAEFSC